MHKEVKLGLAMASILASVAGGVLYINGGKLGEPTTNVPAAATAEDDNKATDNKATDQKPTEQTAAAWPAPAMTPTVPTTSAPQNPFPDASAASSNNSPFSSATPDRVAGPAKATEDAAAESPRPFGANEAADAASQFSNHFGQNAPAAEASAAKNAAPIATSPPPASPFATSQPAVSQPASSQATSPLSAPKSVAPSSDSFASGGSVPSTPVSRSQPIADVSVPAMPDPAAARVPTSDDLQWRPQGQAQSPPRVASTASDNPLRRPFGADTTPPTATIGSSSTSSTSMPSAAASSAPRTVTISPAPRRDSVATTAPTTQTPIRSAAGVATVQAISPMPRTNPIPGGTRPQQIGRVYVAEEGDTLTEIARRELGNPARWTEIQELNREVLGGNGSLVRAGQELILPSAVR